MVDTDPTEHDQGSWQEYVNRLATTHYSGNGEVYQAIPDRTHGDGGLEGFSTCGCGVQAYVDKARNAEERTKSQKKKITTDLKKLHSQKEFWSEMLGDLQLKRWFLVAPEIDNKSVVSHARQKAAALRREGLSFIAPTFQAFVVTDDYFPEAKAKLGAYGLKPLSLQRITPRDDEIHAKIESDPDFISNLDRKLGAIYPKESVVEQRNTLLRQFLMSENIQSDITQQSSIFWEELLATLSAKSESISLETNLDDRSAKLKLKGVRHEVADQLRQFDELPQHAVETMSWGTVAGWMGKCPLRFIENNDA